MNCNCQNPESRTEITDLYQPALGKTNRARSHQLVYSDPVERQEERECLLHVRDKKVVDKDEYLVGCNRMSVVSSPVNHTVGNENE